MEQRRGYQYKVPTRDINFVLKEVLQVNKSSHFRDLGFEGADEETLDMVLAETGNFAETILAPLNEVGDHEGCRYDPSTSDVKTPTGFKDAWQQYVAGGWQALSAPKQYGGTGLPPSWGFLRSEILGEANWAWWMYPGLSLGAVNTLILHASEQQKQQYLTKLVSGEYTGTMCLTEPHCGTDLGQCKTKAVPVEGQENTYKLTGTKIFISCGENDFASNIVHIVLAKLPDAPAGTDGISLFLVPKYLTKADGSLDTSKKNIVCAGIEKKMGIHGSSTCIMSFDQSIGYMIGKPNTGLKQMFTFMNSARIGVGVQALAAMEQAGQLSTPYALERTTTRALSGAKYPELPGDLLIVHGDIRRIIMTQKAMIEAARCFLYDTALLSDWWLTDRHSADKIRAMDDYLGFFTPIVKGFISEISLEVTSNAMQVWGGHGYIRDNGLEQIYRDNRISTLYEGTTAIQALDLLGRKTLAKKLKHLKKFTSQIVREALPHVTSSELGPLARRLLSLSFQWQWLAYRIGFQAAKDREAVGGHANDFLMYSGFVTFGYYWLRMAVVAQKALQQNPNDVFYQNKIHTAIYYADKLLPRADGHANSIKRGVTSLYRIPDKDFLGSA